MPPVLFCASREMYTASTRPKMPPPGSALLPQRSWHGSAVPRGNVLQSGHIGQDRTPNKCRSMKCVRTRKPSTAASGSRANTSRRSAHAMGITNSCSNGEFVGVPLKDGNSIDPAGKSWPMEAERTGSDARTRAIRINNSWCASSGVNVTKRGTPYRIRMAWISKRMRFLASCVPGKPCAVWRIFAKSFRAMGFSPRTYCNFVMSPLTGRGCPLTSTYEPRKASSNCFAAVSTWCPVGCTQTFSSSS